MQRLPVLAALILIAVITASAWLVIDASSDSKPSLEADHLPRDNGQSQQQESQEEPQPTQPDDAEEDAVEQEVSDEDSLESSEQDGPEPPEDAKPAQTPADILIAALGVERPPLPEPEPEPEAEEPRPTITTVFETYAVEPGDTLADIADRNQVDLFDLIAANMLDSPDLLQIGQQLAIPVQAEFEPEDPEPVAEPEPAWRPEEVPPAITEAGIVYGTIHDHERGVINSAVIAMSQADPAVWLVEACIDGIRRTYIMGLAGLEEVRELTRIHWRFDDGPLNTDRWEVHQDRVESIRWCPFLHALEVQEGIRTIWIRIGGDDLIFGVENLIPDEMVSNFGNCAR